MTAEGASFRKAYFDGCNFDSASFVDSNFSYPAIVDKETFDKVQEIMKSRNTQKNLNRQEVFSSTIIPIKCGKCGCDTVRRYEPRTKVPKIMHTCTNPECKSQYRITDDELREKIKIGITQATEKELRPSEETMQTIRIFRLLLTREMDFCVAKRRRE